MIKDLEADLNEADGLRVGEAFTEVFKAGMRVGAAEIIASATEQAREHGVTLDLHYRLVDRADEDTGYLRSVDGLTSSIAARADLHSARMGTQRHTAARQARPPRALHPTAHRSRDPRRRAAVIEER
jgi:hypothetical protein